MYTETSDPMEEGWVARLISEHHEPTDLSCFTFWYHMYGSTMGNLTVYLMEAGNTATREYLWSDGADYGDIWLPAMINVTHPVGEYMIVIESTVGPGELGNMAIDDTDLYPGSCNTEPPVITRPTDATPEPTQPPSEWDCDFEEGDICTWEQESFPNDLFNWDVQQGDTGHSNTGPPADHTLGTKNGWYAYIDSFINIANMTANLRSSTVPSNSDGRCVTFWYHMYGENVNTLALKYRSGILGLLSDAIWSRTGTQGIDWMYGQVFLNENADIELVFEGHAGEMFQGDIALDDIRVLDGECPPLDYCDFESSDICGYHQDLEDSPEFDWVWASGNEQHSSDTGPKYDHTYATEYGHYMYIDASDRPAGDKSRLLSPVYSPELSKCLHFWYHMNGEHIGSLNVYIMTNGIRGNPIWRMSGDAGEFWHSATVNYRSFYYYQVVFEGVVNGYKGDIAIDDVKIIDGPCSPDGACNFEMGTCTWTNSRREDDLDWVRYSGSTAFYGYIDLSGPSKDHTLQTEHGYYMLLNTAIGDYEGLTAMLYSESFAPEPRCFGFWYHMYGSDVGTLQVIVRQATEEYILWETTGNKGDVWYFYSGDIYSDEYYQVIFKGIAGAGGGLTGQGDIALDDIFSTPGVCAIPTLPPPFECGDGVLVDFSQVCNWEDDCSDGSDEVDCGDCNFEVDTCQYYDQSRYGSYLWVRDRNGTETSQTGPSYDHTRGDEYGWYMAVEAANGTAFNPARLRSRLLMETGSHCEISFWYHMFGENIGRLDVYMLKSGISSRYWHLPGNQGDEWKHGIVALGRINTPFEIMFSSYRGFGVYGDIAIDDVSFLNCEMPEIRTCVDGEVECDRGSCVLESQLCDFTDDCGDLSDETDCSKYSGCNFEDNWCDLVIVYYTDEDDPDSKYADFDWWLEDGRQGLIGAYTGPGRDHTTGTSAGSYVYADSNIPRRGGDVALFKSENYLPTTNNKCYLRFYYHMLGSGIGTLNAYHRTSEGYINPADLVFTKTANQGDIWHRAEVQITSNENWQILFEAVIGSGVFGYISIDDISFTPDCVTTTASLPVVDPPTPTPNPCGEMFTCNNGDCIDMSLKCDFRSDCADNSDELVCGTCTFENGTCGWFDNSNGVYEWEHFQAGESISLYAPVTDATGNDEGHFMLVEGHTAQFYAGAFLESPVLGEMGHSCEMDFSYHLHGENTGSLFVYLQNGSTFQDLALLFTVTGDQGNQWQRTRIMLGGHKAGYRIDIESYPLLGTLLGDANDAAIDEIEFINCHPDDVPPNSNQLTCDFEEGWCAWDQVSVDQDDFDWLLGGSGAPSVTTGPGYDHTIGNGSYIYISTGEPQKLGQIARITTYPQDDRDAADHCVKFWYHMYGPHVHSLNMYTKRLGLPELLRWTRYYTQGNLWLEAHRTINFEGQWQIYFEAVMGETNGGHIAIDDIEVTDGQCEIRTGTFMYFNFTVS
ncbi:MAM and LDL-receptor class A domain-containing protein 1-like [Saccoglossus kowalevskii]